MSLLLNIDTALEQASLCLTKDGKPLQLLINENSKDHAAWLHVSIAGLLRQHGFKPADLDAVAVSIGPGSYTGLRVGLAAAKGLCYVLRIPLIAVNTLEMIAFAAKENATDLICPMIDARRMEVFTATYDHTLKEIIPAHALVVDEKSFDTILSAHPVLFCGNGSSKIKALINNNNAAFLHTGANASHLGALSQVRFLSKEFADIAYAEPLYIKEFYSPARTIS